MMVKGCHSAVLIQSMFTYTNAPLLLKPCEDPSLQCVTFDAESRRGLDQCRASTHYLGCLEAHDRAAVLDGEDLRLVDQHGLEHQRVPQVHQVLDEQRRGREANPALCAGSTTER
jgi:hypothetical protein